MRVTFLTPGYIRGPSGGIRVVYEYASALAARGHVVTVVHPRRLKYLPDERRSHYAWLRDQKGRLLNFLSTPRMDWQPIHAKVRLAFVSDSGASHVPDGDAVFATGWPTVASVLEYPRCKGEKCYLIQGYETYHARKELVDETWRAPLRKVVVARWLVELGLELGCHDIRYIPNGIDHTRYRLIEPLDCRPRQVAMMFSMAAIKGAADGIAAVEIVRRRYPDLKVVLFGVCRRQSWIPKWVSYYANPPQEQLVRQIYNRSAIFLAPSWTEGSPLPPVEAACCGCAVVATDIGGFREYIRNGVSGVLSPPRSPEGLAAGLFCLLEDDSLRVQIARAGLAAAACVSWDRSAGLLEEFLVEAVSIRKSDGAVECP